jgi:hypothetical protein
MKSPSDSTPYNSYSKRYANRILRSFFIFNILILNNLLKYLGVGSGYIFKLNAVALNQLVVISHHVLVGDYLSA